MFDYLFQNGHLQFSEELKMKKELENADNFLDSVHVGKTSTVEDLDKFQKYLTRQVKSHPQYITDFNLWSPMLSIAEMTNWTSCK